MTLALAIIGLLTAALGAFVKFYKPKNAPTIQDRLADVDAELAARDGDAVNARIAERLRDARGSNTVGQAGNSPRSRTDVQGSLNRLVGSRSEDAGDSTRT